MARCEVAHGVRQIDSWWGKSLDGKREAVIAAGLAKADWFATGEELNKRGRVVRRKCLTVDGRVVRTYVLPNDRVRVEHPFTKAEIRAAEQAEKLATEKEEIRWSRKRDYQVEFHYGDRSLSCVIEQVYDGFAAVIEALTQRHLPIEYAGSEPVFWDFDRHGRYVEIKSDGIVYGRRNKLTRRYLLLEQNSAY